MYETSSAKEEQKKAEEEAFLLGKEYNPQNVKAGDLAAAGNKSSVGMSNVIENLSSTRSRGSSKQAGNSKDFIMKTEDPMFMVNQTMKEKQRDRLKKQELFEKADAAVEREKSRRTNDRHRSRQRVRSYSRSQSTTRSDDERRRRRKKDKKRKKKKHRSYSSHSDSEDSHRHSRRHRRSKKRRKYDRRERSRSLSQSRSPERKPRSRKKDRSRIQDPTTSSGDENYIREQKEEFSTVSNKEDHNQTHSTDEAKPYGLLNAKGEKLTHAKNTSLGPDEALFAKKRQEKEDARSRYKNRTSRPKMSHEERKAAVDEMAANASQRTILLTKASELKKVDLHDEEIQRRMKDGSKDSSSFVHDMVIEAHF